MTAGVGGCHAPRRALALCGAGTALQWTHPNMELQVLRSPPFGDLWRLWVKLPPSFTWKPVKLPSSFTASLSQNGL